MYSELGSSSNHSFIDELALSSPADPYEPPIRTAEEWIRGEELGYLEQEVMYKYAEEQLEEQGYPERQRKIAVFIARSFDNSAIATALDLAKGTAENAVQRLYGFSNLSLNPNLARLGIAHDVVRIGMGQLIVHSLNRLPLDSTRPKLPIQPEQFLKRRLTNRATLLNLSERETEVTLLVIKGLSLDEMSQRLGIVPRSIGTHLTHIYHKARSDSNRIALMHRLYGTMPG